MKMSIFSVQDHYPSAPRSLGQLYGQVLEQARQAERLGYDTFWVAEHHFHEYGAVPNPAVFLAALSQQTRRLRLGTAISILTFHNPLTVAENYALVDQLSQGRLSLGVGSGYLKHEFEGYDVDPAIKRERFDENLMLVERLLAGERVTHESRHNTIRGVQINVQPVQQPVPVYVAILRREAAYHVGRQGRRMLFVPYAAVDSFEEIGLMMQDYRRGLAEAGIEDVSGMAAVALHTHVAQTDALARERAASAFDLYVDTRLYARKQVYADIIASGLSLFGSPRTVADKLARLADMGLDHVMSLHNFGLLSQDLVLDSMRGLMEEAMPLSGVASAAAQPA
ncbi:LLM class flavin-dependent oxidoreductase [Achromobacter sp. Marseille-Q0513]|uniref:LLM class flavin-dependent oxidoreductase n=1 Tax=Achromobacter sp. Marseille-Q0513 TaxID=2829161 RepID=UPI001B8EF519|nr:LLM class flavin-dependent oxidoreductase [Achromobacter sp. Marseille-Q0513]MBR8655326.1 LLM class flavin-dependent oxidoreductase [Achromobacter sp. Marseille-Q0513]